ncbi:MAG: hypothetical protein PHG16_13545 [Lachnospiraceae bacterium]|nr:hypothetical protein [Lachnospiraceae bacterium]
MRKKKLLTLLTVLSLTLSQSMTVFAVTEADVEAVGKETAAGNIFIWFLCAIAFLKISQKIDSLMSSLGVNVGHTGGSMMAELMIAARGITSAKNVVGGSSFRGGSFRSGGNSSSVSNSSFLSGGLAGAVGRQFTQSAMQTMTGHASNPISRRAFESSVKKGGEFANNVTGAVAQGNINYTGSMTGTQASQALSSYLGQTGIGDAPSFSNVEIGGGRITGAETSVEHPNGSSFGMYHADQYMEPSGNYETVTTADQSTWYKQYASNTVERTPYMTGEGKIAYHENLVQKLPDMPKRKDRV